MADQLPRAEDSFSDLAEAQSPSPASRVTAGKELLQDVVKVGKESGLTFELGATDTQVSVKIGGTLVTVMVHPSNGSVYVYNPNGSLPDATTQVKLRLNRSTTRYTSTVAFKDPDGKVVHDSALSAVASAMKKVALGG